MNSKVRGMILAAGLGTRLRPLTYFRAKAAVPFLNRPFVSYSLELFRKAQVGPVMINLHHLPETVRSALAGEVGEVRYSFEEEILGTAGCLLKVRDFLSESRFVVSNGKIYFEQDLREVLAEHDRSGALVTMVVVPYSPDEPYLPVLMDSGGGIAGFARSGFQSTGLPFIYTGVQILESEVLDYIPDGVADPVTDVYPKLISRGFPIRGFVSSAYWCECSTPRAYLAKSLEVLRRWRGQVPGPPGASVSGSAILGRGVELSPGSVVENSVFWGRTAVGAGSSFRHVIVTDGVDRLPENLHLSECVITPMCEEPEEFHSAAEVGDGFVVWPLD